MPLTGVPSILPGLIRRADEWPSVAQFLSLADLGRLCAVSTACRDEVTPTMMERAALDLIRREEGNAVSGDDLRQFRFHPATRKWADKGLYATACMASLWHVCREAGEGSLAMQQASIALPGIMHRFDLLPQVQDGRAIAWHFDLEQHRVARHLVGDTQQLPLSLPDGYAPYPCGAGGIGAAKAFLTPRPAGLLIGDLQCVPSLYCLDTETLTPLPLPLSLPGGEGRLFMAAMSAHRRCVAMATWHSDGGCLVKCYDRVRDCLSTDTLIADCWPAQISVSESGRIFVGSPLSGYAIDTGPGARPQPYPYPLVPDPSCLTETVFRLSPDERFLIRPGLDGGSLLLDDQRSGHYVFLPRMEPVRPGQQCRKPASIAFSALNALAAVAYHDGLILVFDLRHEDAHGARRLARAELCCIERLERLIIRMSGFDQVHTVFGYRSDRGLSLGRHTLHLGLAAPD